MSVASQVLMGLGTVLCHLTPAPGVPTCPVCLVDPDRQCIWVVGISFLLLAPFLRLYKILSRYNSAVHLAHLCLISGDPKPRQVGGQGTQHSPRQRAHAVLHAPACLELLLKCFLEDQERHMVVAENQEGG